LPSKRVIADAAHAKGSSRSQRRRSEANLAEKPSVWILEGAASGVGARLCPIVAAVLDARSAVGRLEQIQRDAVRRAMDHGLSVVTSRSGS
jgi:hypothetical protein